MQMWILMDKKHIKQRKPLCEKENTLKKKVRLMACVTLTFHAFCRGMPYGQKEKTT